MRGLRVLLVHGMGRTPLSLWRLGRSLRRAGHEVEFLWYHAGLASFARIRERVRTRLVRMASSGEPYAVIGHSFGGVLLRSALEGVSPAPRQFVMLATPNQPSRLAARVRDTWWFRLFNRDSGQLLSDAEFYARLPVPTVPYTIVAADGGPRRALFADAPNDLFVAVSATKIVATDAPVVVPGLHSFIMNQRHTRTVVSDAMRQR